MKDTNPNGKDAGFVKKCLDVGLQNLVVSVENRSRKMMDTTQKEYEE